MVVDFVEKELSESEGGFSYNSTMFAFVRQKQIFLQNENTPS